MFDVTIPELLILFEIRRWKLPNLPPQLNYATYGDLSKTEGAGNSGMSWNKRKQNPRAPHYYRYHISLISENGVPIFAKAFSFLDRYKL